MIGTPTDPAVVVTFELKDGEAWMEKRVAGDTDVRRHPADDEDRTKYRAEWEAFRAGHRGPLGTPIEAWPEMTKELAAELRYRGIPTVESLAATSDGCAQGLPNGYTLRKNAAAWLKQKVEDATARDLAARDDEIDTLRRMVREQGEQIAQLLAAGKAG